MMIILFLIILAIIIWGGVTQWRFVKGKDKEGFEGKNLIIVILAGGPPKKNRQRFLEEKNGKPTVQHVIDACTIPGIKLCIVISGKNSKLKKYSK